MSDMIVFDDQTSVPVTDVLAPWVKRRDAAHLNRKQYERQFQINQAFARGAQWLSWSPRDNRVIERKVDDRGRPLPVADVLNQYANTVIGKIAADDLRPELLLLHDDQEAKLYGDQVNDSFGWAWDNEAHGDQRLIDILRVLTKSTGTGAIRVRYDRTKGQIVGDVPHKDGKPLLDEAPANAYVEQQFKKGERANFKTIREGQIVWEVLSGWNLLPPPGIANSQDFPWEIIVRPVALDLLKQQYGARADNVGEANTQTMATVGQSDITGQQRSTSDAPTVAGQLKEHALVYTGYKKPDREHPSGQTVVFTHDNVLLDATNNLPLNDQPYGARSGVTYFHWEKLDGRFWSKAFIEAGIGPQKIRNKRLAQMEDHIDKGQAKVYTKQGDITETPRGLVLENIELRRDAMTPVVDNGVPVGAWMYQDVNQQDENVQKALGLNAISLGQPPTGVSAYSAMALVSENDSQKLDVIGQEFKLSVADVGRDTLEAMRQWPPDKEILLAGDDDRLAAVVFNAKQAIPSAYMVRPAKGGTLPRSQAAEIQKIADLWNAAVTVGATVTDPLAWLDWYKSSLDEGQADDLPAESHQQEQIHKAALENIVMARTGQPVPVAEYDDPAVHIPEHEQEADQLQQAGMYGDQQAAAGLAAVQQHIVWHQGQAQQIAANQPAPTAGAPPTAATGATDPQQAYFNSRAVQYENQVLAPRPPRIRG